MLKHIVLIPFNKNISEEKIQHIMEKLENLQQIMPEIKSFTFGKNINKEGFDNGYFHGFIMEFENEKDLTIYLNHPKHVELAEQFILPFITKNKSPLVFDFIE